MPGTSPAGTSLAHFAPKAQPFHRSREFNMLRWSIVFLAASLLAVPASSMARPKPVRKGALTRIQAKKPAVLRQSSPDNGKGSRQNAARKPRPTFEASDLLRIQLDIEPIRDAQIELLAQLIADTPANKAMEKADLLFRLAEMHATKARYLRFQGMEQQAKIDRAEAKKDKAQKRTLSAEQAGFFERSKKALLAAVRTYASVADDPAYIEFSKRDQVLYYYARSLEELGGHSKARQVYQKLIKDHPASPMIADALMVFADYYFENESLPNAERFYDRVLELKTPATYDYALYKRSWVYYNQRRFQDALEGFYDVATRTRGQEKRQNLTRAARKDYVRVYAEIGKPRMAYRAFQRVDKKHAFDMLQVLADVYIEQGKGEKAIYTLRSLIRKRPDHDRVCLWQRDIVDMILSIGTNNRQKAAEIENLVALYKHLDGGVAGKAGKKASRPFDRQALGECRDAAADITGYMARVWHDEGVKTRNRTILADAASLYDLYLASFSGAPDFGETQYFHAELLWQLADTETDESLVVKRWEDAATAFASAVSSGQLKGQQRKESAYAAVLAWQYAIQRTPDTTAAATASSDSDDVPRKAQPIPARERKMLAAFDFYIDNIKDRNDTDLIGIKFLKAVTYARHHHHARAIPIFSEIVKRHASHPAAVDAAIRLLDSLVLSDRSDELIRWVRVLQKRQKLLEDNQILADRVAALERTWLRKQAEDLEKRAKKSGDYRLHVACGAAYVDIYNNALKSDGEVKGGDEVLYNAGVCFEDGKSLRLAFDMYELLIERHPDSPHAHRAWARHGTALARAGYYEQSADKLAAYARRFGGEEDAAEALSNAVFFYKGTGDDDRAIEAAEFFLQRYGKRDPDRAADAMFGMTAVHEKLGDPDKVVKHLQRYLRQYGKRGGIERQIIAHARIGELLWQQSCPVRGVGGNCIKMKRSRNLARQRAQGDASKRQRCGDDSRIRLSVVERDRKLVKEAQRELNQALALYDQVVSGKAKLPGDDSARASRMAKLRRHAAASRFLLAEEQYESYLALQLPGKLDFDPRKPTVLARSNQLFLKWLADKKAQGARTETAFKKAVIGDAHYAIASAARIGQISQNLADALFAAEIPRHLRRGRFADEQVHSYCDSLAEHAQPLETNALRAFELCLKTSTRLSWFSRWSRECERELGQIAPDKYPTAAELRPEPGATAAIVQTEGVAVLPLL